VAALVAAGVVVLVHLAYLVYAAVGGFLGLRGLLWLLPHLISTAWSITVTVTPVDCPLTALEKWLLELSGQRPYDGSFTSHYLRDVVYPYQYETLVWLGMMALAALSYVVVLRARIIRGFRVPAHSSHHLRPRGTG
jgi:hypothetical protein